MSRGERLRAQVRDALEAILASHGFHRRGTAWVRELGRSGDVRAWTRVVVVSRGDDVHADALVGARSEAIERTLATIAGGRRRRREAPTWYRPLSLLHPGTPGTRSAREPWAFRAGIPMRAALQDFSDAFTGTAVPLMDRSATNDGLAQALEGGRVDGDTAWRLPIAHFLRGDAPRTREALEQATHWVRRSHTIDPGAYRAFALELLQRLGDSPLEPTPAAELLGALRPVLREAFPARSEAILAHLVRSFWWESHPRTVESPHCSFCGSTEAETPLSGAVETGHAHVCDACVSASAALLRVPGATRGSSAAREEPASPPAASLAAEAVRALRASGSDEHRRLVPEVERRLLGAAADRPAGDVCIACGPLLPPRAIRARRCAFCSRAPDDDARYVDGGRVSICDRCVERLQPRVRRENRLG